jgi:hypothetical protein
MSDRSGQQIVCDTDHYLVVAEIKERLAVSKQTTQRVHMEKFNLKRKARRKENTRKT